jgi:hypothetical protein
VSSVAVGFRSFLFVVVLGLAVWPLMNAAEVSASGISIPFFDDAGRLTHKMLAKVGTKSGQLQKLQEIEIHYFSATDPNVIVQKLEAEDATWDDKKETLVGRGPIVVATVENRLTGNGFDFALATSLLHIHENFTMTNREVIVTSDRATVELIVERAGDNVKVRDVKRCEAIGHLQIVVQPTATKTYPFEKAFSEIAIYDGSQQTVTLPKPTRTVNKRRESTVNTLTINLRATETTARSPRP